jgi:hypothetical protein
MIPAPLNVQAAQVNPESYRAVWTYEQEIAQHAVDFSIRFVLVCAANPLK